MHLLAGWFVFLGSDGRGFLKEVGQDSSIDTNVTF